MAISEAFASSQAVDTTEWSCPRDASYDVGQPQTADGVYQVLLDLSDMVLGDILQIRVYEKVQAGSTSRVMFEAILRDNQATSVFVIPSLILLNGWDVTLDALAGTITVEWSIRKVA